MERDELTGLIINCSIEVHKRLGPGLLESVYLACLEYELVKKEIAVKKQVPLPVLYDEVNLDCGFRIDLLVDERVIVEVKAVEMLHPVHSAQTLTYMKLSGYPTGLLINFNVKLLIDGLKRFLLLILILEIVFSVSSV